MSAAPVRIRLDVDNHVAAVAAAGAPPGPGSEKDGWRSDRDDDIDVGVPRRRGVVVGIAADTDDEGASEMAMR